MIGLILNAVAVTACGIGCVYACKFVKIIRDKTLLVLPLGLFFALVLRTLTFLSLLKLIPGDPLLHRDLISLCYVLLAIGLVLLFRASLKFYNGRDVLRQ